MAYPKKSVGTDSFKAGQDHEHIIPSTGDIDRSDFRDEFVIVENVNSNETDELRFMHEKIEVQLNPGIATDEQTIQVQLNGINQFFVRGMRQNVKRMFVNVLCGAKTEHITTVGFKDSMGNDGTKIQKTSVMKYPFTVLSDPNPKGRAWLEKAMSEA